MNWIESKAPRAVAVRFAVLFVVLLAPIPWLADAYTTAYGTVANVVLYVADHGSRFGFRFEPPESLRASGSWTGVLRVEDRQLRQTARMKLDVRAFSYRPLATFVALGVAARLWDRRRNATFFGAGLLVMLVLTSALTVAACLKFGVGRLFGIAAGPVSETVYEALTTPAMTFLLPFLCFCVVLFLVKSNHNRENAAQPAAVVDGA